ncbi:MAG: flagellar hook-associated protein FlgK [Nitrospirales bacterium]|nr:flagellar hook-associated protein FlgK [Nitrospirales bacterium]
MSLSGLFNIGRSAMLASQTALTVTGNNIANVNTPGFSRQEVILGVSTPAQSGGQLIGSGVTASGVRRSYDSFVQTQLFGQSQNEGRSAALAEGLNGVEQVFNDSGDAGMASALSDFFNAWQDVAANPEGRPQRTLLLQKAQGLISTAQATERGLTDVIKQTNAEIVGAVNQVNDIAAQIASLNDQIVKAEAGQEAGSANDFRDRRDRLLNDLGNLIDAGAYENQDGSVTVLAGSRALVSGGTSSQLTTSINAEGNAEISIGSFNITQEIGKGQIGGFLEAQAEISSGPLADFRKLIASVVKEVNLLHETGYGLDGSTGNDFFSGLQVSTGDYSSGADISSASVSNLNQVTLDEYNITFDGSNNYFVRNALTGSLVSSGAYSSGNPISFAGLEVTISGAVTASDRFFVSPLTDAVKGLGMAVSDYQMIAASSSSAGVPGDGSNAEAIGQLTDATVSALGDSFNGFYGSMVSAAGTASKSASDSLSFEQNLLTELNTRRDSVSGVSLDEEAVNMIQFQRSYEAAARMIQVTDELMQTILNL